MKKLVVLLAIFSVVWVESKAQSEVINKENSYCLMRVYGQGFARNARGIFIVYEDLTTEQFDIQEGTTVEIMKKTLDHINQIEKKGYTLVNSTMIFTAGQIGEYIFRKNDP